MSDVRKVHLNLAIPSPFKAHLYFYIKFSACTASHNSFKRLIYKLRAYYIYMSDVRKVHLNLAIPSPFKAHYTFILNLVLVQPLTTLLSD